MSLVRFRLLSLARGRCDGEDERGWGDAQLEAGRRFPDVGHGLVLPAAADADGPLSCSGPRRALRAGRSRPNTEVHSWLLYRDYPYQEHPGAEFLGCPFILRNVNPSK